MIAAAPPLRGCVPVTWPPYHHTDQLVTQIGQDRILQEVHAGPGYFYDWSAFANLAFMAALNEYNRGYQESADRLYDIEMQSFDGQGWPDLAYDRRGGIYETLGPAWSIYTAAKIGMPLNEQVLALLLEQQDPQFGGFHTHYRAGSPREADPNIETTSLALLALDAWQRRSRTSADQSSAIQRAVTFLEGQYNPQVGLLRESPVVAPHRYWLATDNRLALYALQAAGTYTLTNAIASTLQRYDDPRHGLIEALQGQIGARLTYTETHGLVTTIGPDQVWLETRLSGNTYSDLQEYADLALYDALKASNNREHAEALRIYRAAMQMWNGIGFADKAYQAPDGHRLYATYKLALALYVAQTIGEPPNAAVLQALLAQQDHASGGFYPLYDAQGVSQGDPSTETTAYAILAFYARPK